MAVLPRSLGAPVPRAGVQHGRLGCGGVGQAEPDRVCTVPGQPGQQLVGAAGPRRRGPTNTDRPGRLPGLCPGSCANAARSTVMWSAAVFDPAFPLGSMSDSGSPVRSAPWLAKAQQRHRLRRSDGSTTLRYEGHRIRCWTWHPSCTLVVQVVLETLWGRFGRGGGVRWLCLSRGVLPVRLFDDDLRRLGW